MATASDRPDPLAPPEGYGQPLPDAPHGGDDTSCDLSQSSLFAGAPGQRCGGPGEERVWFGCENEHVGYVDLCLLHSSSRAGIEPVTCQRCGKRARIIRTEQHPAALGRQIMDARSNGNSFGMSTGNSPADPRSQRGGWQDGITTVQHWWDA